MITVELFQAHALSVVLALSNHVIFNRYEPQGVLIPVIILLLQLSPVVLLLFDAPLTLVNVLSIYSFFLSSLSLSIIGYRLSSFHPLAAVPGPLLPKISKHWGAYIAWTGNQHRIHKAMHDRYGPIVRTVFGASGLPKGAFYRGRTDPNAPSSIIVLNGNAHDNRRRLWNREMSAESLKEYDATIGKRVQQLLDAIERHVPGRVDLAQMFNFFGFDVMGDIAFGQSFDMLVSGDVNNYIAIEARFSRVAAVICQIPWIHMTAIKIPNVFHAIMSFHTFAKTCATRRIKEGATIKDLWYHLTDEAGFEKQPPPILNVVSDGGAAVVGGADTTSAALSSLIWFLIRHPECYKLLQRAIDTVYPPNEDALDIFKHDELTNETLRLHPPVPTLGGREVAKGSGGRLIAGIFLPEGTQVYVPLYSTHRNPANFSYPDEFYPGRWLSEKKDIIHNTAAFMPFSYGSANCVGKNLAMQEILTVVIALSHKFEMHFADGFDVDGWSESIKDYYVTVRGPLYVKFIRLPSPDIT